MKNLLASAIIGGLIGLAPAGATPMPVRPTGKWTVNYSGNLCVLQRSYGTAEHPLVLGFKPSPMAKWLRLIVLSKDARTVSDWGIAKVRVGQAKPEDGVYHSARLKGKPLRLTFIDVDKTALRLADTAMSVTIDAEQYLDATFVLEDLPLAFEALDACVKDLLKSWGMDQAVLASIATPPIPEKDLSAYVNDNDYPPAALVARQQGASGIRFWVGVDGRAHDCKVVEPSGSDILDAKTCQIMTGRPRFTPAMNGEGKPVPSLFFTRLTWRLYR